MIGATPPRLISPFVLAERDYLVATRGRVGSVLRGTGGRPFRLLPIDA